MNEMNEPKQCFHLQSGISQVDYNYSGCSRSLEGLEPWQHVQTPLIHMRFHLKHRYGEPKTEITLENVNNRIFLLIVFWMSYQHWDKIWNYLMWLYLNNSCMLISYFFVKKIIWLLSDAYHVKYFKTDSTSTCCNLKIVSISRSGI